MKTTYTKSRPETIFQLLTFTFEPSSMSSGVIVLQRPYISFSSPLLLILRREITTVTVALLLLLFCVHMHRQGLCWLSKPPCLCIVILFFFIYIFG